MPTDIPELNEIGKSYLIGQAMITDKKKKPTEQSDTFSRHTR